MTRIDFAAYRNKQTNFARLIEGLTLDDLRAETNAMIDRQLALIADCNDADVVFVPDDPDADDTYAIDDSERELAWTLGHVIVHATASSEESAALAAELARGVEFHGRSRYEVPWREVTTVAQCRARLAESRRMRLASLEMWPDEPHYDNTYPTSGGRLHMNCIGRFVGGLIHDYDHLEQIEKIVAQANAARRAPA